MFPSAERDCESYTADSSMSDLIRDSEFVRCKCVNLLPSSQHFVRLKTVRETANFNWQPREFNVTTSLMRNFFTSISSDSLCIYVY